MMRELTLYIDFKEVFSCSFFVQTLKKNLNKWSKKTAVIGGFL
jgi:hypothetical protein